jgi:hypothetical protein
MVKCATRLPHGANPALKSSTDPEFLFDNDYPHLYNWHS